MARFLSVHGEEVVFNALGGFGAVVFKPIDDGEDEVFADFVFEEVGGDVYALDELVVDEPLDDGQYVQAHIVQKRIL